MNGCLRMAARLAAGPVPPGATPRVEWQRLPEGAASLLALAAAAAVAVAVVWLYRRERTAARPLVRWTACAARLAVLGLVAVLLLQPTIAFDIERLRPGEVFILADRSASMSTVDARLPDGAAAAWARALGLGGPEAVRGMSRHQILRSLLGEGESGLAGRLRGRSRVRLMTFAGDVRPDMVVERGAAAPVPAPPAWEPTGDATDVAGAIRAALREAQGSPTAGILLLTDGRHTAWGSPEDAAREAGRARVPIYAVGIGDPARPRNVALLEIVSDDHVMRGSPLRMQVVLKAVGLEGRPAEMSVEEQDTGTGERRPVARRTVALGPDGALQQVEVEHTPEHAGQMRYAARIEPLEGEARDDDNAAARWVTVMDDKVRALLIASAPSLEYRFLSSLIDRDPGFELSLWLQSRPPGAPQGGDAPLDAFPSARETVLSYDVVVLMDPDPREFSAAWMDSLSELVERHGGGLVWVASMAHTDQFLSAPELAKARSLLPVVVGRDGAGARLAPGALYTEGWPIGLTAEGAAHPVAQVRDSREQSASFWAQVPGLYWTFPVERAKPGATVLLRYKNPSYRGPLGEDVVLAAIQPYGAGRTFFLGCDESWRWRSVGIAEHRRFWVQLLRYLVRGRLLGARKQAQIVLDSASYKLGDAVRIRATLLDRDYRPLQAPSAELAVERDGVRTGSVTLERVGGPARPRQTPGGQEPAGGEDGAYEGVFYPPQYGEYSLVYKPSVGEAVREPLRVDRPEVELEDVTLAVRELQRIGELSGGSYVPPEAVAELAGRLPDVSETTVEPGEPSPLWDTPLLLAGMVALLGAEWLLRRRMGGL